MSHTICYPCCHRQGRTPAEVCNGRCEELNTTRESPSRLSGLVSEGFSRSGGAEGSLEGDGAKSLKGISRDGEEARHTARRKRRRRQVSPGGRGAWNWRQEIDTEDRQKT